MRPECSSLLWRVSCIRLLRSFSLTASDCAHLFTTVIPIFQRLMCFWFIHVYMPNAVLHRQKYLVVLLLIACCHISAPPPWTVNYRNRLPPALGVRIWFLTKCLHGDYVGFDVSSDTEVLMLLKDSLTIPPMISYTVDVYLLFVLFTLLVETQSAVCVLSLISALSLHLFVSLSFVLPQ